VGSEPPPASGSSRALETIIRMRRMFGLLCSYL
jgi:hypothetical protein